LRADDQSFVWLSCHGHLALDQSSSDCPFRILLSRLAFRDCLCVS
jgi:hypothetical protein